MFSVEPEKPPSQVQVLVDGMRTLMHKTDVWHPSCVLSRAAW